MRRGENGGATRMARRERRENFARRDEYLVGFAARCATRRVRRVASGSAAEGDVDAGRAAVRVRARGRGGEQDTSAALHVAGFQNDDDEAALFSFRRTKK